MYLNQGLSINSKLQVIGQLPPAPYVQLDRTNWIATGSNISSDPNLQPQACIDASGSTRYLSQTNQYIGMFLEFDFNALVSIRQIEIEWSGNHWARNFKLMPSTDGTTYGSPIFSGVGINPSTVISQKIYFSAIQVRKIRLEITSNFNDWLSLWGFRAYS